MNGIIPASLRLEPDQAGAARQLARFAARHEGVSIVAPHYHEDPWRADIGEGSVPGGDATTQAILTARQPAGLLAKLEDLFGPPG